MLVSPEFAGQRPRSKLRVNDTAILFVRWTAHREDACRSTSTAFRTIQSMDAMRHSAPCDRAGSQAIALLLISPETRDRRETASARLRSEPFASAIGDARLARQNSEPIV